MFDEAKENDIPVEDLYDFLQKMDKIDKDGNLCVLNDVEMVVCFENFEDFITLAVKNKDLSCESCLYRYQDEFYLTLVFDPNNNENRNIDRIQAFLYEYGKKTNITRSILKERGEKIETNVFNWVRSFFDDNKN